jgi:hypothetical protein
MHNSGTIDLFAIAGYARIGCSQAPLGRSVWHLFYEGTQYRVAIGDIRAYLAGTDSSVAEFVLTAGDKDTLKSMLVVAKRNFRDMAVELQWGAVETFEINSAAERVIANNPTPLVERITSSQQLHDICDLPAVFVFDYNPQQSGIASAYWRGGARTTTGATLRNNFMTHLFGTLLAHEMGHTYSLCHAGHDGVQNIMFTAAPGGNNCGVIDPTTIAPSGDLDWVTGQTIIEYVFAYGEPHFTFEDAKNTWIWILGEGDECVGIP